MPRAREELTAGEWAALTLLDEEPTHGFAVARAMASGGDVGRVWAMRRPLVYRALDTLERLGLARPVAVLPSDSGPQRTILEPTAAGRRAVAQWLARPVEHVRDARSLLMLKLLFLARREADPAALLTAQRERFAAHEQRLAGAVEAADGFDRGLLLWRLHSTSAAVQFTEVMRREAAAVDGARRP
jgi:DNA-binding PadR family transcriptional regulator